jgi:hypothetical protein
MSTWSRKKVSILLTDKKFQIVIQIYFFEVEVRLQATPGAPIISKKNYKVDADRRIDWIITFLRRYLKMESSESLVSSLTPRMKFNVCPAWVPDNGSSVNFERHF